MFFSSQTGSNNVSVISDKTNKVVATVAVGLGPAGVAHDGGKREVFVADGVSDNVSVISDKTNKVVATVAVGSGPDGVAWDSANCDVYVSNYDQGTISIIEFS